MMQQKKNRLAPVTTIFAAEWETFIHDVVKYIWVEIYNDD